MPPDVRGVALIVVNPSGEVLVLQEFHAKPHFGKYAGMLSIPMETSRSGEPDHAALERLVAEELPGLASRLKIHGERFGVYRVVPRVWVSLYTARAEDAALPILTPADSREVGNHAWMLPENAMALWLRQGAREMLSDYIHGRMGTVCRRCQPVMPVAVVP